MNKKQTKSELFLELAGTINEKGFSRKVPVEEFTGKYEKLQLGNGGSWCRDDSSLAKKYNVVRHQEGSGNKITHIELQGFQKTPTHRPVNAAIKRKIQAQSCVILGTSNPECDHKDGRLDDPRLSNTAEQKLSDFQPLSKAANMAKREHCKKCRKTDKRFDARQLGYKKSQIMGNGIYRGTCVGCYWYDPKEFNRKSSIEPTG